MTVRSARIVVAAIDDDQTVLRSIQLLLESAEYEARLFSSAAAFLNSGCLDAVECLVSDIDMPGIDGIELMKLVHRARPDLPTILITGYPDRLQRMAQAARPSKVFTKPFQGPEFLAAIDDAVRNDRP